MKPSESHAMAHDAMHSVIHTTATVNARRLAVACQGVDDIGAHIVAGAFAGIVSWAVDVRDPTIDEKQFVATVIESLQDLLKARIALSGPTAGSA